MKKSLVLAAVILSGALAGNAQLVTYDFENGTTGNPAPASFVDGDVSASSFDINAGRSITYPAGNPGQAISATGWTGDAGSKYWEFTLTANAGIVFDLSNFSFDYRSTGSGPTQWSVSINGSTVGSGAFLTDSTYHSESFEIATLSGLSSAQIQLVGYGTTSGAGRLSIDNVVLDGLTLTQVPEPSTWALLGGGLAFLAYRMRRRK